MHRFCAGHRGANRSDVQQVRGGDGFASHCYEQQRANGYGGCRESVCVLGCLASYRIRSGEAVRRSGRGGSALSGLLLIHLRPGLRGASHLSFCLALIYLGPACVTFAEERLVAVVKQAHALQVPLATGYLVLAPTLLTASFRDAPARIALRWFLLVRAWVERPLFGQKPHASQASVPALLQAKWDSVDDELARDGQLGTQWRAEAQSPEGRETRGRPLSPYSQRSTASPVFPLSARGRFRNASTAWASEPPGEPNGGLP